MASEAKDSVDVLSLLSARFGGMCRLISGSGLARRLSARKDDADERSDRRLDFPVSAALVSEWSELPDESDGDSCDLTDAAELTGGDLTL